MLILNILLVMIATALGLVGIFGDTWKPTRRRLTLLGWVALGLLIAAFGVGGIKEAVIVGAADMAARDLAAAGEQRETIEERLEEAQGQLTDLDGKLATSTEELTQIRDKLAQAEATREQALRIAESTRATLEQAQRDLVAQSEAFQVAEATRQAEIAAFHAANSDARQNIRWVIQLDAGARKRFDAHRSAGRGCYEAVLDAQNHNTGAQETIRSYGSGYTTLYIQDLGVGC